MSAQGFRRGANRVRKQMWYVSLSLINPAAFLSLTFVFVSRRWKDMKMRIVIGVGIVVLIIIIVVPIVKA